MLLCMKCWLQVVFGLWPLNVGFTTMLQMTSDKGTILMQNLLETGELTMRIAILMLCRCQPVIDKCDEYHKQGQLEMEDSIVVGAMLGSQGYGIEDKRTIMLVAEQFGEHSGFMVAQQPNRLGFRHLEKFRPILMSKIESRTPTNMRAHRFGITLRSRPMFMPYKADACV